MKFLALIYIIFFIVNVKVSAKSYKAIELGSDININVWQEYPTNEKYKWKINSPENSIINSNFLLKFKADCHISFKPDLLGDYEVSIKSEKEIEGKPYQLFFNYEVLESLAKSVINLKLFYNNKYYYNNLEYYKLSTHNELEFNVKKEYKKINFQIEGLALIRDIIHDDYFLINSNTSVYLKENYNYEINFYPNNYKSFQAKVNTSTYNRANLELSDLDTTIKLNASNFQNQKVLGVTTVYYKDIQVSKPSNKNISIENAQALLFTPIKYINNFPSVFYQGNFETDINIKYDDIEFYKLNILIANSHNEYSVIKVRSITLDKCLINSQDFKCKYEKTINASIEENNIELSLASGKYEVSIYKKGYEEKKEIIVLSENKEFSITSFSSKTIIELNNFNPIIKYLSFTNKKNQNFFYENTPDTQIHIAKGLYDISLFTENGLYEFKDINIDHSDSFLYKNETNNILIKLLVKKDKQILNGGTIFFNKNYQFNNKALDEDFFLYIKKSID